MKYQKGNDDFTKVSVNISNDVLVAMDTYAEQMGVSRSAVFNIWLRRGVLFEDEMVRSMGASKRLKRISKISDEKFLEQLQHNLLRAGNYLGGNYMGELYFKRLFELGHNILNLEEEIRSRADRNDGSNTPATSG